MFVFECALLHPGPLSADIGFRRMPWLKRVHACLRQDKGLRDSSKLSTNSGWSAWRGSGDRVRARFIPRISAMVRVPLPRPRRPNFPSSSPTIILFSYLPRVILPWLLRMSADIACKHVARPCRSCPPSFSPAGDSATCCPGLFPAISEHP